MTTTHPLLAAAALAAAVLAAPAVGLAQVTYGDGGADPGAPNAYAGVSKEEFYAVDSRISAVERQIQGLNFRARAQAMAGLNAIRSFESVQRARHNGALRDWDREAINTRLDRLSARFGLG